MSWPAVVVIVLVFINLGSACVIDGRPKEGNHKFIDALFNAILLVTLLLLGGFFK